MNPLLRGTDVFVAEVPGVDEPTEAVLKPHPHTNALTGAAAIVKVLPHLHHMCAGCHDTMYMYKVTTMSS